MENNKEEKTAQKPAVQAPKPSDELLKNGSVVLTAKTREELIAMSDSVATCIKDRKVCVGVIGYSYQDHLYCVTLNIIN